MCGGEVLVWQADGNADNNYLTYIRSLRQNLHPFVDAMFDYKGTNNIKSNQSLALSVCKINTISFTYLSDSIPLFQLYEGDSTKGILVRCVMKCERQRERLRLPSAPSKCRETFTPVKSYILLPGWHDEIKPSALSWNLRERMSR